MQVYLVIPRFTHWHVFTLDFTEDILEVPKLRRNMFLHITLILLKTNMKTEIGMDVFIEETRPIMTCRETSTYADLSCLLVNLRVISSQPIISQDNRSVWDSQNIGLNAFIMTIQLDDEVGMM